jgi:hypothetical protein
MNTFQSENRYRVPKGTKFYQVKVRPLQKDSTLVRSQHHHHKHSQQSVTQSQQQQLVRSLQEQDSSAMDVADEESK